MILAGFRKLAFYNKKGLFAVLCLLFSFALIYCGPLLANAEAEGEKSTEGSPSTEEPGSEEKSLKDILFENDEMKKILAQEAKAKENAESAQYLDLSKCILKEKLHLGISDSPDDDLLYTVIRCPEREIVLPVFRAYSKTEQSEIFSQFNKDDIVREAKRRDFSKEIADVIDDFMAGQSYDELLAEIISELNVDDLLSQGFCRQSKEDTQTLVCGEHSFSKAASLSDLYQFFVSEAGFLSELRYKLYLGYRDYQLTNKKEPERVKTAAEIIAENIAKENFSFLVSKDALDIRKALEEIMLSDYYGANLSENMGLSLRSGLIEDLKEKPSSDDEFYATIKSGIDDEIGISKEKEDLISLIEDDILAGIFPQTDFGRSISAGYLEIIEKSLNDGFSEGSELSKQISSDLSAAVVSDELLRKTISSKISYKVGESISSDLDNFLGLSRSEMAADIVKEWTSSEALAADREAWLLSYKDKILNKSNEDYILNELASKGGLSDDLVKIAESKVKEMVLGGIKSSESDPSLYHELKESLVSASPLSAKLQKEDKELLISRDASGRIKLGETDLLDELLKQETAKSILLSSAEQAAKEDLNSDDSAFLKSIKNVSEDSADAFLRSYIFGGEKNQESLLKQITDNDEYKLALENQADSEIATGIVNRVKDSILSHLISLSASNFSDLLGSEILTDTLLSDSFIQGFFEADEFKEMPEDQRNEIYLEASRLAILAIKNGEQPDFNWQIEDLTQLSQLLESHDFRAMVLKEYSSLYFSENLAENQLKKYLNNGSSSDEFVTYVKWVNERDYLSVFMAEQEKIEKSEADIELYFQKNIYPGVLEQRLLQISDELKLALMENQARDLKVSLLGGFDDEKRDLFWSAYYKEALFSKSDEQAITLRSEQFLDALFELAKQNPRLGFFGAESIHFNGGEITKLIAFSDNLDLIAEADFRLNKSFKFIGNEFETKLLLASLADPYYFEQNTADGERMRGQFKDWFAVDFNLYKEQLQVSLGRNACLKDDLSSFIECNHYALDLTKTGLGNETQDKRYFSKSGPDLIARLDSDSFLISLLDKSLSDMDIYDYDFDDLPVLSGALKGTSKEDCDTSDTGPDGFHIKNEECWPNRLSCRQEIDNAASAVKIYNDISGDYGACSLVRCKSGHIKHLNSCISKELECMIANGSGKRVWNSDTNSYGDCKVSSCNSGYSVNVTDLKSCREMVVECDIAKGKGKKYWDGSEYGECIVQSCDEGFSKNQSNSSYEKCTETKLTCSENEGLGYRIFDGYSYSECLLESCIKEGDVLDLQLNSCSPEYKDCSSEINYALSAKKQYELENSDYGDCLLESCIEEFSVSGNQCTRDIDEDFPEGRTYLSPRYPIANNKSSLCYDENQEISCPSKGGQFYGQDGSYQLINFKRFSEDLEGVLYDKALRAYVTKCTYGKSGENCENGFSVAESASDAIAICSALETGTLKGWSLPDSIELLSLFGNPGDAADYAYYNSEQDSRSGKIRCINRSSKQRSLLDEVSINEFDVFAKIEASSRLLMTKCAVGKRGSNCENGADEKKSWKEALELCENLNLSFSETQSGTVYEHHDYLKWRLPSAWELNYLLTINSSFEYSQLYHFRESDAVMTNQFWTATTDLKENSKAYQVSISENSDGDILSSKAKAGLASVICVAESDGSWGDFWYENTHSISDQRTLTIASSGAKNACLSCENEADFASCEVKEDCIIPALSKDSVEGSYIDSKDGRILDLNTGSQWTRCLSGKAGKNCEYGELLHLNHSEAKDYCRDLYLGGHSDWEIPSPKELAYIMNYHSSSGTGLASGMIKGLSQAGNIWLDFIDKRSDSWTYYSYSSDGSWSSYDPGNKKLPIQSEWDPELKYPAICVRAFNSENVFIANKDGSISDLKNNLMWQKGSTSHFIKDGKYSIHDPLSAKNYCKDLKLGGYSDWRLPSVREFQTLIQYSDESLAAEEGYLLNKDFFPIDEHYHQYYWTSTIDLKGSKAVGEPYIWSINIADGRIVNDESSSENLKNSSNRGVKCVRNAYLPPKECADGEHLYAGKCKSDIISCDTQNGEGEKTWNSEAGEYSECKVKKCDNGYHKEIFGENAEEACFLDKQSCHILNGAGQKEWQSSDQKFSECKATICDAGYGFGDKAESCEKFTAHSTDLKSCKAYYYNQYSEDDLNITYVRWCGDIPGRFNKKLQISTQDFVYDNLLKGYWSRSSVSSMFWDSAADYCSELGPGWTFPDAYQMLSLFSKNKDTNEGHINPIFSDNDQAAFWSSTKEASVFAEDNLALILEFSAGGIDIIHIENLWPLVRCFRPGIY